MKKNLLQLILILCFAQLANAQDFEHYFWYNDEKIEIFPFKGKKYYMKCP